MSFNVFLQWILSRWKTNEINNLVQSTLYVHNHVECSSTLVKVLFCPEISCSYIFALKQWLEFFFSLAEIETDYRNMPVPNRVSGYTALKKLKGNLRTARRIALLSVKYGYEIGNRSENWKPNWGPNIPITGFSFFTARQSLWLGGHHDCFNNKLASLACFCIFI